MRDFALFGETTGETDEFGLPVRGCSGPRDYRGAAAVVYGHTPVAEPEWLNNTINIDTGCVFGGRLTALRWPERELVSVPARARRTTSRPSRSCPTPSGRRERPAFLLDVDDVAGKRIVADAARAHRHRARGERRGGARGHEPLRDRPALARLPAADDGADRDLAARRTCSSTPTEAFAEYRADGVAARSICEEKHMGSRAIVVVCRDAGVARDRFGVDSGETGAIYTRTGRPFLDDADDTEAALARVRAAVDAPGCGTSSAPTGSCSTASCCRGRRRRWS